MSDELWFPVWRLFMGDLPVITDLCPFVSCVILCNFTVCLMLSDVFTLVVEQNPLCLTLSQDIPAESRRDVR